MSPTTPLLFQPTKIGPLALEHRIVLSPLTRFKSGRTDHIPITRLMKEYYSQRSSTPKSLLITEGTFIAARAGGIRNVPGIWNDEQIDAWREITEQVHANGCPIFLQLWALGRAADPDVLASEDPSLSLEGPSSIPLRARPLPLPKTLSNDEVHEYVQLYRQAAKNAVEKAGFDGVEIHGANGYLIDQFLQDMSNDRRDEYGGSVENRSRFALEIIEAITEAIGVERTSLRISPWSPFMDMAMPDPKPQFSHLVSTVKAKYPKLAYLHLIEPRVSGHLDRSPDSHESNDFIRKIWKPLPLVVAGGYTRASALKTAEENGDLVAFGRMYIANPDLPYRIKNDIPLTPYLRTTFYIPGDEPGAEEGYTDYPFALQCDGAKQNSESHL